MAQQQKKTHKSARAPSASTLKLPLPTLAVSLSLTLVLFLGSFLARVQDNVILQWSFWGAVLALILWQIVLFTRLKNRSARQSIVLAIRPQHYVQALVQFSLYAYWGYYWQPVYDHAWLLVAQLLFAYNFDMLLAWSRGKSYMLGFGPFPIIFSINLFLWFRDDWFYMQFLMIAAGFLGKEYVRWQRDGKSTHIFNPSAFALGLFSLLLIISNTTDLTWGQEIASTLTLAPNIYAFLFLIGLIVMYFFSITLVAGAAAIMLFGLSALYSGATGVPYFLDSEIPAAVFLGLHLLITDPSTSPRTALGKTVFGALYGLGVFALYAFLSAIGVDTFYDKLLIVPLLNLCVIGIDRLVQSIHSRSVLNVWPEAWVNNKSWVARANVAHMTIWAGFFLAMTSMGATDGRHTGDSLPFWQQACQRDLRNGCTRLVQLEVTYCGDNAAWACNELGAQYFQGRIVPVDSDLGLSYFSKACELRFQAACLNLLDPSIITHEVPHELDLRLLLRQGGLNLMEMSGSDLLAKACEHNWEFACARMRRSR